MRPTRRRPTRGPRRRFGVRRKTCYFCDNRVVYIDYKSPDIRNFQTERGKIVPSKLSGVCAKHQRMMCRAIKTARNLALMQFSV
jgi:small subunit ribosomal protein S18